MRHNAETVVETAGPGALAEDSGLSPDRVEALLRAFSDDVGRLPETGEERAFERALARAAVRLAMSRHAGTLETVYTGTGPVTVQHGKDLGAVGTLIGTGGVLAHGPCPRAILEAALADTGDPFSLRPRKPRFLLDRDYVLFACGLLASVEPDVALTLGLNHMHPLAEVSNRGRHSAA